MRRGGSYEDRNGGLVSPISTSKSSDYYLHRLNLDRSPESSQRSTFSPEMKWLNHGVKWV